jgi:predicted lipid-binding transport protein (Tim44 family)
MNPQSDQTPGLRLPQPSFNMGQAPATPPTSGYQIPTSPTSRPMAPSPASQQVPVQQQSSATPPIPAVQEMPSVAADDENAIDQEWVNKARETVERTHGDPYLESRELSKIKAQYIKIRYNKDIKSVED